MNDNAKHKQTKKKIAETIRNICKYRCDINDRFGNVAFEQTIQIIAFVLGRLDDDAQANECKNKL